MKEFFGKVITFQSQRLYLSPNEPLLARLWVFSGRAIIGSFMGIQWTSNYCPISEQLIAHYTNTNIYYKTGRILQT